jgi:hypothetical protein
MIKHQLTLDYSLNPGWMAPYAEGLLQGKATARHCASCNRSSFPPLRTCSCGDSDGYWEKLSGEAQIIFRSDGCDGSFGLVHFDGADTQSVVRIDGIAADKNRGQIALPDGQLPMIILQPITEETSA